MSLMSLPLPTSVAVAGWIVTALALGWAVMRARRECWFRPLQQHAWFGAIVAIALLWSLPVTSQAGLGFGLMGSALFALLFGRALAILGLTIAGALLTLLNDGSWANLGVEAVLLALLPAWLATALQRRVERWLPHHLFVFIIGNGLFVTLATTGVTSVLSIGFGALLQPALQPALNFQLSDHFAYALLLAWGEALLSGMLFSALVIFAPSSVRTYDLDRYLPVSRAPR